MINLNTNGVGKPIKIKRQHSPSFKSQVALSAIRGEGTIGELSHQYSIHPTQIKKWKDAAILSITNCFTNQTNEFQLREKDKIINDLYCKIGKLTQEIEWSKKKMGSLP